MLRNGRVAARLPAQDLARAKAFYAEKLGLEPAEEREGGLRYVCAAGEFALFESAGTASGDHTQMGWEVEDIDGNYPSKGSGERGAWFRDSEGNMLGIGQPVRS
jgi:catechol 2,3-dioxygenase-like lactoylglutathione lyase family enzyme